MATDFSKKTEILGQFYFQYGDDTSLEDFIEYSDIGLPLAYLASEGLCEVSDDGAKYIAETWDLFLAALEVEDSGFDNIQEVFAAAKK